MSEKPEYDYTEIVRADIDQLLRWWNGTDPIPESAELRTQKFLDNVATSLMNRGDSGIAVLRQALRSTEIERQRAALGTLPLCQSMDHVLYYELQDTIDILWMSKQPELKASALVGAIRMDEDDLNPEVVKTLLDHPNEDLAAEARIYLSRVFPEQATSLLCGGLSHRHARVRFRACEEIQAKRLSRLIRAVRRLAEDRNEMVAVTARQALRSVEEGQVNCATGMCNLIALSLAVVAVVDLVIAHRLGTDPECEPVVLVLIALSLTVLVGVLNKRTARQIALDVLRGNWFVAALAGAFLSLFLLALHVRVRDFSFSIQEILFLIASGILLLKTGILRGPPTDSDEPEA